MFYSLMMFTLLLGMRREEESPQTGEELRTKVESRSLQTRQCRAEESVKEQTTLAPCMS